MYGRSDGSLEVAADGIRLGEGTAALTAALRGGTWSAKARLQRVSIEVLAKLAKTLRLPLPAISATGQVNLTAEARGAGSQLHDSTFDISFAELTLNNESGSVATDKLDARIQGTARKRAGDWQFAVELSSAQGQAYAQPIFLDFGAHALRASATGKLREARELTLERFTVEHAQVVQASGRASFDLENEQPLRSLSLRARGRGVSRRLRELSAAAAARHELQVDADGRQHRGRDRDRGRRAASRRRWR